MPNFLVAALMLVVVAAIPSRAGDPAAQAAADEPGTMLTIAVRHITQIAVRVRGRVLASHIRDGMTLKQVEEILGPWDGWGISGGVIWVSYSRLRLRAFLRAETNAVNDRVTVVTEVFFFPRFAKLRLPIPPPPPSSVAPDGF
jgi:hypothetical protein